MNRENLDIRRKVIPIVYVRGTHYDVGYEVVNEIFLN